MITNGGEAENCKEQIGFQVENSKELLKAKVQDEIGCERV